MSDALPAMTAHSPFEPSRRDFLFIAAASFGVVGSVAALLPLINQLAPDASTIAGGAPVDLDLDKIAPGQQVMVQWRQRPVFVVNRTPQILKMLQDQSLVDRLSDPHSSERQQPPYADNWHRSIKPEYGVMVGICTHLACIPKFDPKPDSAYPAANWMGGYFCPCHGSKYDLAGRVFRGVPAPYNLPVPPYRFVTETKIRIGENPVGVNFNFCRQL